MAPDDQMNTAMQQMASAQQKTNIELVKIGGAVQTSADGITELLRRSTTTNQRNGWQVVLLVIALLGMCFSPLVFTMKGLSEKLDTHAMTVGHEGMDARVTGVEKVLYREEDRNTGIEDTLTQLHENVEHWQAEHDRRVLSLNTAQSKKGEEQGRFIEILWNACMPPDMGPYPVDASGWPRLEP